METRSKSLNEMPPTGNEIFTHGGVGYVLPGARHDDTLANGTLSIVSYSFGKCIEWKPNDVSIDAEGCGEQEWTVVNTSRTSSLAGPNDAARDQRWTPVLIPLSEIKSYRVSNKKTKLLLVHKDRVTFSAFYFQFENADCFTKSLRSVVKTRRSRHDKHTYNLVHEHPSMPQSFSDFNLIQDQKETVWKFVNNLRSRPYETTLSTFSKFSEYLLYKYPDERPPDEMARVLEGRSVPTISSGPQSSSISDYQVVEKREQLPPRQLRPRGPPLTVQQWANAMNAEGLITDPNAIKNIIFEGGVHDSIRYEVWKFLLGYFSWESTSQERQELRKIKTEEYFKMKLQWKSMSPEQEGRFSDFRDRKTLIEKDVNRTDRTVPFFEGEDNPNLKLLYDVLMTYIMYDFDLGYVQGMSDLLSPILSVMSNEVDAFWCFVGFMKKVFRNFDMDQSGMKKQLSQLHTLLSAVQPDLSTFLEEHDSGNMFFCFRWLLVWFKREFSHEEIMELWEVIWTDLPCKNFHLLVSVSILEKEKDTLIQNNYGFTEILKHVNDLAYKMNLHDTLSTAAAIYKQLEASPNLTVATRRVLGLLEDTSRNSSSSDDASLSECLPCDMTTLERDYERGVESHYF